MRCLPELLALGEYMIEVDTASAKATLREKRQELARALLGDGGTVPGQFAPITPRDENAPTPLSFAQERLWFLDQWNPQSSVYNTPMVFRLRGALDSDALQRSLAAIVDRHEALRTTFPLVREHPVQLVHEKLAIPLVEYDLTHLCEADREREKDRVILEEASRPFDLAEGPLIRSSLLLIGSDESILLLTIHHIVTDGWSRGVLVRELAALYESFSLSAANPLPPLRIQYADFALWQRNWLEGGALERELDYWKRHLAGAPALLELPGDRSRPSTPSYQGARTRLSAPVELAENLIDLSKSCNATLFMTLLAAFYVLLSRYSGQEDIVIGTPIANRTQLEIESLIGFFSNALALRGRVSADLTFRELLMQVRETALEAYAHQGLPIEKLVEDLQPERSLSHAPLFQVFFMQHAPDQGALELPGLVIEPIAVDRSIAKMDLLLSVIQSPQALEIGLEYNTDLFDEDRVERLLSHYQKLLEGIVANPNERVSCLPLLTQAECSQLLVEWNDTSADYRKDVCIHQLFEEQVRSTPDAAALVFAGETLTYSELNVRANQLARFLQQQGVQPNTLAAVCMARSIDMVVALLAILKAGGAYVAVDPAYPVDRIRYTLQDAAASVILTQEALLAQLPVTNALAICLDRDAELIGVQPTDDLACITHPTDLAYVLYTSGSTGRPKGVAIEHHSPVALVSWALGQLTAEELSGVVFATSICFDLSVYELFVTLCGGGRVLLVENALAIGSLGEELSCP